MNKSNLESKGFNLSYIFISQSMTEVGLGRNSRQEPRDRSWCSGCWGWFWLASFSRQLSLFSYSIQEHLSPVNWTSHINHPKTCLQGNLVGGILLIGVWPCSDDCSLCRVVPKSKCKQNPQSEMESWERRSVTLYLGKIDECNIPRFCSQCHEKCHLLNTTQEDRMLNHLVLLVSCQMK